MTDLHKSIESKAVILVHWPHFGPYHIARLQAAAQLFSRHQMRLVALEISSSDNEYLWERASNRLSIEYRTLFPDVAFENISGYGLFFQLWSFLERTRPSVIAINGYSTKDAFVLLLWCLLRGRASVLMSETKAGDSRRRSHVEFGKSFLVRRFQAALCGGAPHKAYLETLGMPSHVIFDGYDAVDNQFFVEESDRVRKSPDHHHRLTGLEDGRPFFLASGRFIPRKNFRGLIQAFAIYRQTRLQNGHTPWRLVILGDGPERYGMEREMEQQHLAADVCLAGVQSLDNLPAYYGLASVFIHPALQDQWGLVVNEAMASGLPVLVSERAGCAYDLVEDGKEGFKFSPEDLQGLASMMIRVSSGEVDLNGMGRAAREKISHWGVDRFAYGLLQAVRMSLGR